MSRRVTQDPDVFLGLELGLGLGLGPGACRPRRDRIRLGLVEVIDPDIEMQHLLLFPGLFRPHRGPISGLGLK